jgi:hypothetical protein
MPIHARLGAAMWTCSGVMWAMLGWGPVAGICFGIAVFFALEKENTP